MILDKLGRERLCARVFHMGRVGLWSAGRCQIRVSCRETQGQVLQTDVDVDGVSTALWYSDIEEFMRDITAIRVRCRSTSNLCV